MTFIPAFFALLHRCESMMHFSLRRCAHLIIVQTTVRIWKKKCRSSGLSLMCSVCLLAVPFVSSTWMNEMSISVGGVRRSLNYWLNLKSLFSSAYINWIHFVCIRLHVICDQIDLSRKSNYIKPFSWCIRTIIPFEFLTFYERFDNLLQPLMIRLRELQANS